MNPGDLASMNRQEREDYLARREQERWFHAGSLDPRRKPLAGPRHDRRQVAAWMKGGLQEYLQNQPPRQEPS